MLVLGVPWYEYRYECLPGTGSHDEFCPIPMKPFRGINCSDAAGAEVPYHNFLDILLSSNVSHNVFNANMQSPSFNVIDSDGSVIRYWFDDVLSLTLKKPRHSRSWAFHFQ